jgi:hypothetical protein
MVHGFIYVVYRLVLVKRIVPPPHIRRPTLNDIRIVQWHSKGIAKCAYVRGTNCKRAQNCAKVIFLSYNQIDIFPLHFMY